MVNCPLCDSALDVDEDEIDEGDDLTCEECGATLRVMSTDPLELESADEDDEEDEEPDEDFEEEDEEEEEEEEDEDAEEW
jgi:alpha-aminoadipate carrier protein LysW